MTSKPTSLVNATVISDTENIQSAVSSYVKADVLRLEISAFIGTADIISLCKATVDFDSSVSRKKKELSVAGRPFASAFVYYWPSKAQFESERGICLSYHGDAKQVVPTKGYYTTSTVRRAFATEFVTYIGNNKSTIPLLIGNGLSDLSNDKLLACLFSGVPAGLFELQAILSDVDSFFSKALGICFGSAAPSKKSGAVAKDRDNVTSVVLRRFRGVEFNYLEGEALKGVELVKKSYGGTIVALSEAQIGKLLKKSGF